MSGKGLNEREAFEAWFVREHPACDNKQVRTAMWEGWQARAASQAGMPREPTEEMRSAGYDAYGRTLYEPRPQGWAECAVLIYRAMHDAAPRAQSAEAEEPPCSAGEAMSRWEAMFDAAPATPAAPAEVATCSRSAIGGIAKAAARDEWERCELEKIMRDEPQRIAPSIDTTPLPAEGLRVCTFEDCLADAWYKGRCRSHGGIPPCRHCGQPPDDHVAVNWEGTTILICPTSVYERDFG